MFNPIKNERVIEGEVVTENKLFKDFFTIPGLAKFIGVHEENWDEIIVKEIIDNALKYDLVQAYVITNDEGNWLVVEDDGPGINSETIEKIFNPTTYSTSNYLRTLQPGMFGVGLKIIASICQLKFNKPLVIETKGVKFTISLEINRIEEKGNYLINKSQSNFQKGCKVTVPIGDKNKVQDMLDLLDYINFHQTYIDKTHIHFYQNDEFKDIVIKLYKSDKNYSTKSFLMLFHGLNEKSIREILRNFPKKLRDIIENDKTDKLYKLILKNTKKDSIKLLQTRSLKEHWENYAGKMNAGHYEQILLKINNTQAILDLLFLKEDTIRVVPFINRSLVLPSLCSKILNDLYVWDKNYLLYLNEYANQKLKQSLYFHIVYPRHDIFTSLSKEIKVPYELKEKLINTVEKYKESVTKNEITKAKIKEKREKTIKEAVFEFLEDAIIHQTNNLQMTVYIRNIFYEVREKLIKANMENLVPQYDYFTPKLINEFFKKFPDKRDKLEDYITYKETGYIYFPDGTMIRDTLTEIKKFKPNFLKYNKVIFIEKSGLLEGFIHKKFPQRYDCIMVTGGGYASRAIRVFLEILSKGAIIFCLHDFDLDGFGIYEKLQRDTETMPTYNIKVIDLGFKAEDINELAILPENIKLDSDKLKEIDKFFFNNSNFLISKSDYEFIKSGKRVELNSISMIELVEFVERKLRRLGFNNKVLPSFSVFSKHAEEIKKTTIETIAYQKEIKKYENEILKEMKDLKNNFDKLVQINFDVLYQDVKNILNENPPQNWREYLTILIEKHLNEF